jgi:hypothetical protein
MVVACSAELQKTVTLTPGFFGRAGIRTIDETRILNLLPAKSPICNWTELR